MDNKIVYYLDEVEQLERGIWVPPVTVEIDPSNRCQNKCSFCIFSKHLKSNNDILSEEIYLELLEDLARIGTKSITFTGGGEPLTHPNILKFIKLATRMGFEVGLITNGINLDKIKDSEHLLKFIRISLNAASPQVYNKITGTWCFNQVISNIRKIVGTTCVGISFVVCEENQQEIEDIKQLGKYLGVDYVQLKPLVHRKLILNTKITEDITDTTTIVTNRYRATSNLSCTIAGLIGIVGAGGDVWYCCQTRGMSSYLLGNLKNSDFETLWRGRNKIQQDVRHCASCRYSNYAEAYKKYKQKSHMYLRHKNFL